MSDTIENLLSEARTFDPPPAFAVQANATAGIYEEATDFKAFWEHQARQRISWFKQPTVVLDDSNPPFFKWFTGGTLNATEIFIGWSPGCAPTDTSAAISCTT